MMKEQYPDPREWVLWWDEAFLRLERDWCHFYKEDIEDSPLEDFAAIPFFFLRWAEELEVIDHYPDEQPTLIPIKKVAIVGIYCEECQDVEEWFWLWPELFMEGSRRCCGKPFTFNPLMFWHYQDVIEQKSTRSHIRRLFTIHSQLTGQKEANDREWAGYGTR
jgi:hypothetical protein